MNSTDVKRQQIDNVDRTVRDGNTHEDMPCNNEMDVSWDSDVTGNGEIHWSEVVFSADSRTLCTMCGGFDHLMSECPNIPCLKCGEKTDSYGEECLMCVMQASTTCDICGSTGHSRYTCPYVWNKNDNSGFPGELITMNPMPDDSFDYSLWNDIDESDPIY